MLYCKDCNWLATDINGNGLPECHAPQNKTNDMITGEIKWIHSTAISCRNWPIESEACGKNAFWFQNKLS